MERVDLGLGVQLDWQSLFVFLEVERAGSFRAASLRLGLSINAIRRRVEQLEAVVGAPLITRHVDGVRLTGEGRHVLQAAAAMENAAFGVQRLREASAFAETGEVRIAVTEGLGAFWIAPQLVEFQRANPRLTVDLRCAMESADVLRLEADVAVQLTRPTSPDLRVVKLGRMHVMPYAAHSYAELYGLPETAAYLAHHRIVVQAGGQTVSLEEYARSVPGFPAQVPVTLKVNTSSAYYWAIARGAGLGLMPTYASASGARVMPVDNLGRFSLDIWLTYHPDAERIGRVRRVIDWLRSAFSAARYPWFGDEFIHPRDLPSRARLPTADDLMPEFTEMAG
ncbi:LysR family transcriptional regulator [Methylobacterium sp. J-076]|uniref:LysR family transcriptional regulator n=1 Tax=Methylobacterium sp. J-076 TaxID=2836655 RepID=UPI001FB9CAF0|nr:LysR family transcriptional regulator [Methylobacterium sp. J-076]MCJ2015652.1 LysR family transcriptional regulator [Methylobacterium sp. J-076]